MTFNSNAVMGDEIQEGIFFIIHVLNRGPQMTWYNSKSHVNKQYYPKDDNFCKMKMQFLLNV